MTCQDARAWLSDLLDDALEPHRRVEVDTHLATCGECRFELDRLRATVGALRRLEHPRAPAGFVDRVVQRVRPVPWYRRIVAWVFLPVAVKLPAEAAVVVVVAGLAMLVWERTPELRSAARLEPPTPSSASNPPAEPTPRAPSRTSPSAVPGSAPRSSGAPRARSQAPPPSPAPGEPEMHGAPGENIASAPPAPEAKAERGAREEPAARPPASPESPAAHSARSELRPRTAPQTVRPAVAPTPQASDLAGRLIVGDRVVATAGVVDLVSQLGGRVTVRRQETSDSVLDVQIPAARYDDFIRGLDTLGSWTPSGRPDVLSLEPPQIRMTIRVTE